MPNTKVTLGSIWAWFGEVFVSGWLSSETKLASAGVDGTEYILKVDEKTSETTITVLEGQVRVKPKLASWPEQKLRRAQRLQINEAQSAQPPTPVKLDREAFNKLLAISNRGRTVFQDPLVPDLLGLTREQAEQEAQRLSLKVSTRPEPVADRSKVDRVLAQRPAAGERGERVELRVGVEAVSVPDLSGSPLEDARKRLEQAGLRVGRVRKENANRDLSVGTVFAQAPKPGTAVARSSTVELTVQAEYSSDVAAAPKKGEVPHVIGLAPEEAIAALAQVGLQAVIKETFESGRRAGVVMDQNPSADSPKPASGTVEITVSLPMQQCQVPDLGPLLRGYVSEAENRSQIEAAIRAAGLTPEVNFRPSSDGDMWNLRSQSPNANERVDCRSKVVVEIGRILG